ncbi:MAG: hypothetical protein Q8L47_05215 [bacterium]|nr:hypothetical protein [bacterium]
MSKEENRIDQEREEDNTILGIELTKEIANRHEKELRELILQNDGANILEPIKDGKITAEQLVLEFEQLARERDIDLDDFYEKAGRYSYAGHRFEATTFIQILYYHFAKKSKK